MELRFTIKFQIPRKYSLGRKSEADHYLRLEKPRSRQGIMYIYTTTCYPKQ